MKALSQRLLSTIVILLLFLVSMGWIPGIPLLNYDGTRSESYPSLSPITKGPDSVVQEPERSLPVTDSFTIADGTPIDGILAPVLIEQVGYTSSGTIYGRTDSMSNTAYSLPLDDIHGWQGSRTNLHISDLTRLYALNGSFLDGTVSGDTLYPDGSPDYYPYGWGANSINGDDTSAQVQRVSYENSETQYVIVENKAKLTNNPQHQYTLYNGTTVFWNQTIDISPATSDFILSFNYLYQYGPIDGTGPQSFSGNVFIEVIVGGTAIYSISLKELTQRSVWFSTGQVPISLTPSQNPTMFKIGINVNNTFVLDADNDYDYTLGADGASNAEYVTVLFDDVSLTAAAAPSFEQVNLQFNVESTNTPVTGNNGIGSASISNSDYWTVNPIDTEVTSNTTVSFEYETILRTHRFSNSTWMTDNTKMGVQYAASAGESPQLSFNTYIGFIGGYINLTTRAWFPSDWQNVTVFDPFLTDVTSSCSISENMIEIPTSLMGQLGWWKFSLESPNYAMSIKSQILDITWKDETLFRIGNITRADITIGTATQVLASLTNVNITWFDPSDLIRHSELISGGSSGRIFSTQQTFASGSSPAGEWRVEVYWANGTEVAYALALFEIHHSSVLTGDPSEITTDAGLTITSPVRYTDGDTGDYLMDESATLVANWSGSIVYFAPNPVKNWWQADLDTSIVGAGVFTVTVNATRPYYDDSSCQILIRSINVTRLSSANAPWTSDEWGHIVTLTFNYESYDYGMETWGPVVNDTDVSASIDWTADYWSVEETVTPGIYAVSLNSSGRSSGTYLLNATFSKPHHQTKTLLLTLIIAPVTSSLSIVGKEAERVDLEKELNLTLRFVSGAGAPISNASVVVDSVSPPIGLSYTSVVATSGQPGNYSLSVTSHAAGVFTIRFVATESNTEPASTGFVLVVNDVDTILEITGPQSIEIGLTDVYNTTFRYETMNGTGVDHANISVIYSGGSTGALSWNHSEIGLGDYSIEFRSSSSGTYLVTIAAFKQYYQGASDAVFLIVREITAELTSLNGTADIIGFGKSYQLYVSYTNSTGYGLSGANVTVENVVPATGLLWGNTTTESQGVYSILLTPQETNTFTLLVQANLSNHQTRFILFTLTATEIATSLNVLTPGTTISLDQTFTAYLLFHDEDLTGLEGASLTIPNPPAGASFSEFDDLGNGSYRVTVTPLEVGIFDIVFKASKNGYQNGYASLTLGAVRIPTSMHVASGLSSDSAMFSESYELLVLYDRIDTELNVTGATIDLQALPNTGISWSYIEADEGYLIIIETTRIGRWTLTITANKTGYASSSVEFILDVDPIPIQVVLLSGNSVVEGTPFDLVVQVTQQGTSIPVTNASVSFRISAAGSGDFLEMHETSTAGVYTAQFSLPSYSDTTEYTLEIRIEKDNYLYPQGIYEQPFIKTLDFSVRMAPIVMGGSGILAAVIILLAGLRISSKRKKVQLDHDLVNKRRFDDADNIIGVIVLHKKSGIPIYSKMMKGGFEEGIVAAFITAVTHFREEFEMFDTEAMNVIPISDIIRAVQTRSLICAFITVKSASIEHNRKLEAYAMQVGTYLDDLLIDMGSEVADPKITEMLDYIFQTAMDGFLLKFYKVATSEKFPGRYKILDDLMHDTEMRHCTKPILLAKGVTNYGFTEARGCTLVLEAIEKELIVVCEEHESEVPEIDFAEFFSKTDSAPSSES